jgi:putative ABC transport system permease protein
VNPRRPDLDDLDRDIRDHLDAETADHVARGMSEAEARAAAIRKFGNVTKIKEDVRGVWVPRWIDHLRQDARDAGRQLRRNPAFTAIVILTLAIGIGLTTAVYSVVNAVLVRPLAFPHPDRLVWLTMHEPVDRNDMLLGIDFVEWRAGAATLERAAAYGFTDATFAGAGDALRVRVVSATEDFWEIAGVTPALGRLPAAGDLRPLVVTHQFFVDSLDADPDSVGRPVTLDGEQATIVGVLPERFVAHFPVPSFPIAMARKEPDMFRPLTLDPNPDRTKPQRVVMAIGKLKSGVTASQALAELDAMRTRAASHLPPPFNRFQVRVRMLHDELIGTSRFALSLLLAAALVLLLIACANVANLLLARSASRQREIALRMAVGGGPLRILRQLLFETLSFAAIGGVLGVITADALIVMVSRVMADAMPRLSETTIDGSVLAFATVISVVTALLFGFCPAVALCRTKLDHVLRSGGRQQSASGGVLFAGRLMVSVQLALTLMLLAGAGLMLKSVWRMNAYPAGFDPEQILTMRIDFRGPQYRQPQTRVTYAQKVLSHLSSIRGIRDFAIATFSDSSMVIHEEGKPADVTRRQAGINATSARFAQILGMQLVRGRWLQEQEPDGAFLINETLARTHFAGRDPIGVRIRLPYVGPIRYAPIVGIVTDLKYSRVDRDVAPEVFVNYEAAALFGITVVARTDGDPMSIAPTVRKALAAIDPTQSTYDVQSMSQMLSSTIAHRRFNTMLLVSFAGVALLLAAIGLCGVVAYAVSQRTNEIGIRLALGAPRARVVRMIVRQGMTSVLLGLAIGLASAWMASTLMARLLYGVEATDRPTLAIATIALTAISCLACTAPALRAAAVDPAVTLRAE